MTHQRCYMSGEAGLNPNARWEGAMLTAPYEVPGRGWCVSVHWDTWTGPRKASPWTDIQLLDAVVVI